MKLDWLIHLDRRIIYVFIFLAVLVPFLFPFDMPIKANHTVLEVYNKVEELSQKNQTLLISFDFDNASMAELKPMAQAILAHAFQKNIKVVAMGHWQTGIELAKATMEEMSKEYGKEYGKDWTYLGWKPQLGILIMNMGKNFRSAFEFDYKGNKTSQLEVTKDIHTLKDFGYVISLSAGSGGVEEWVAYGQTRFNITLGAGCTAVGAPDYFPYLQSKQLTGLLGGLVGAAQYEVLVDRKGSAFEGMKPQSVSHLVLIFFIIFGNICFLIEKFYLKKTGVNHGN